MLATPIQTITTEEEIETTHVLAEVNKQETLKKVKHLQELLYL